ncbi:2-isopropylmalate synthase [Candidatus Methylacidithermus pantelleriae]|uniref:2-isopropylmalate synthase n=1 Tax=Candidatus Methylacidithermus pantelleriae TaxID=2744239 RepID=A0A8J2BU45_9BACT|nr:2-isopropylmalate synthase [Candidatus Methylacidithermus pantelleriae]CAF0699093.1 2-isopropylmalate synthase [Candidatus Methylacidithermus pantelleriae]
MNTGERASARKDPKRVILFDTTLRDGEQCPGASMTVRQKLEIARQLARLGVDVIEAGFPAASPGDREAVWQIASEVQGPRIAALARCVEEDIEIAAKALQPAGKRARIHVFLATSPVHRQYKLAKAEDEIVELAVAHIRLAKQWVEDVEFSPEDGSRTERDFLVRVVEAAIEAGATTINIPDTVGCALPQEFAELVSYLLTRVPNIDQAVLSVHCHDDLGLAVANSLAALKSGARQVEGTINGIGERAGNAALEEIIMALKTRSDAFGGLYTGVCLKELVKTSRLVSRLSGLPVQRNKAIVGENAFAHGAGIHQDGILKRRETYEIMDPEEIGWGRTELPLTKHSGRAALEERMKQLGFQLTPEELAALFQRFKELGDKKKFVYDDDLVALMVENELSQLPETYRLEHLSVVSSTGALPTAAVRLRKGEEVWTEACVGDGAVDAAMKAIDRITGKRGDLLDYQVRAVSQGKDALGEVMIKVDFGEGCVITARAASTDVLEASARAYLNAVNRALFWQSSCTGTSAVTAP